MWRRGEREDGRIRVLHVLTDTNVGGAGTLLYNTMACADHGRFDYVVALPEGSRLVERFARLACRVVTVKGGKDRSADMGAIGAYIRLLRRERPHILHTHAALAARVAGRLAHVPVCIQTRHCVFPLRPYRERAVCRWLFRHGTHLLSDRVIAVAEAARDQLCRMGLRERDVTVIVNGVRPVRECASGEVRALRERLGLTEAHVVIGMAARLEAYKGQEVVLRAAAECHRTHPELRFLFMGDGSCLEQYRALARALGVESAVIFAGFVEDLAPYYALMDINVNASSGTETSSLALSEGMSVGLPCVASDYGGNPYMVVDGENGLLFPTGDHRALASALVRLLEDSRLYQQLSDGARARYRAHLTADGMVRRLEGVYMQALGEKDGWNGNGTGKRLTSTQNCDIL